MLVCESISVVLSISQFHNENLELDEYLNTIICLNVRALLKKKNKQALAAISR